MLDLVAQKLEENDNNVDKVRCEHSATRFLAAFPDVPVMSTLELLGRAKKRKLNTIIVDCRHQNEQAVSMFKGAVTLKEFNEHLQGTFDDVDDTTSKTAIVCYCTVGWRSNKEARIIAKMPKDRGEHKRFKVHNHEGIVPVPSERASCSNTRRGNHVAYSN